MKYLSSITNISWESPTNGSPPVEVLCDDFNYYLCKYSRTIQAYGLVNEYLANQFLELWGLKVPKGVFANISENHLPNWLSDKAQPRYFRIPTFGVQRHTQAKEIDNSLAGFSAYFTKLLDRRDLLKIALFDLWVSNEDRHAGNYNLMIDSGSKGVSPYFMPIDHWDIFNSRSLNNEIYLLSFEESLINSSLFTHFCKMSPKLLKEVDEIVSNFNTWKKYCNDSLDKILKEIPDSWNIDIPFLETYLKNNIFRNDWLEKVANTYREYIHLSLS